MPDPLSPNLVYLKPSETVAISNETKRRRALGEDVIDLSVGEPDFDTPALVAQAGITAIQKGMTRYAANIGIAELRSAMAKRLSLLSKPADCGSQVFRFCAILRVCLVIYTPTKSTLPSPCWRCATL